MVCEIFCIRFFFNFSVSCIFCCIKHPFFYYFSYLIFYKSTLVFRVEKEAEPKIPKKRGPKPKIKLDENGEPIDPNSEKKPKR